MIVVSNTSPLTNLSAIGQLSLLRHLYTKIHIAQAVENELNAGGQHWPGSYEVATAQWIEHCAVHNRSLVTALQRDLDQGEAESIALALEIQADLVLLDEKAGRHAAQRLGLRVVGVVGILLEAKAKGVVTEIRSLLNGLREIAGFYLSEQLYHHALELAKENDK